MNRKILSQLELKKITGGCYGYAPFGIQPYGGSYGGYPQYGGIYPYGGYPGYGGGGSPPQQQQGGNSGDLELMLLLLPLLLGEEGGLDLGDLLGGLL